MENATSRKTGPVPGHHYAVIILTGGFDIERFSFPTPLDALVAGIRYLREGRQVRLTDRTCAALKEVPGIAGLDDLIDLVTRPATGPAALSIVPLKAADDAEA